MTERVARSQEQWNDTLDEIAEQLQELALRLAVRESTGTDQGYLAMATLFGAAVRMVATNPRLAPHLRRILKQSAESLGFIVIDMNDKTTARA